MQFEIRPPKEPGHYQARIDVSDSDSDKILRVIINDIFGDDAVICLEEPQRSEFIRRIKELKTND